LKFNPKVITLQYNIEKADAHYDLIFYQ